MMRRCAAWVACAAVMLFLWAVLLDTFLDWVTDVELHGVSMAAPPARWSPAAWFSGRFQREAEAWINENIGFRGRWVRTESQINFSVFRQVSAKFKRRATRVVLGSDDWLYEEGYLTAYGKPGKTRAEVIAGQARRWRRLQDALAQRGIGFVFIIAPSKAEIHPEHIPPWFLKDAGRAALPTEYQRSVPVFREHGVHVLDGHDLFLRLKRERGPPLFAPGGVHWTYYGAAMVLREAAAQLAGARRPMPAPAWAGVEYAPPRGTDRDLADLLNLWTDAARDVPMPYPKYTASAPAGTPLPRVLILGDSFAHTLIDVLVHAGLCESVDLLYYYKRRIHFPGNASHAFDPATEDWGALLLEKDIVMVVLSEIGGLPTTGYEFARDALRFLGVPANTGGSPPVLMPPATATGTQGDEARRPQGPDELQ